MFFNYIYDAKHGACPIPSGMVHLLCPIKISKLWAKLVYICLLYYTVNIKTKYFFFIFEVLGYYLIQYMDIWYVGYVGDSIVVL